jgi:Sulfotransferase family
VYAPRNVVVVGNGTKMEDNFAPPPRFATASDQLHDVVAAQVGSTDFGGDDYLWGLQVLLQSMDYDPVFSEQGRRIAWGELISSLSSRVQALKSMKQHPGFDRQQIIKPVVITGIPRTGTTALHKLMAVDPQFQGLQTWLLGAPMPRPPRDAWESYPQFQQTVERLNRRYAATPQKRAAHHMAADEVDECVLTMRSGFVSNVWSCFWSAATYDAWWQTQSELPGYRYLHRVLQLIGSNDTDKRWLLKNPGHIANLDLLFAVFPDAKVIQTHRDPAKAIPSLCALLIQNHSVVEVGRKDQRAQIMGQRETAKWAKAVLDAEPVRQTHRGQVLDVVHSDFHRDPMGIIKRIYSFIDMQLSSDVADAMATRIDAAPELSHGTHRYAAADFGLTAEEIRAHFGDYINRFDLRESK